MCLLYVFLSFFHFFLVAGVVAASGLERNGLCLVRSEDEKFVARRSLKECVAE